MDDGPRDREERPADLGGPEVPRGWVRHPREQMLITPLMAGIGGLLAFFTVVFVFAAFLAMKPPGCVSARTAPLYIRRSGASS